MQNPQLPEPRRATSHPIINMVRWRTRRRSNPSRKRRLRIRRTPWARGLPRPTASEKGGGGSDKSALDIGAEGSACGRCQKHASHAKQRNVCWPSDKTSDIGPSWPNHRAKERPWEEEADQLRHELGLMDCETVIRITNGVIGSNFRYPYPILRIQIFVSKTYQIKILYTIRNPTLSLADPDTS
uniref:Uncharacterized protein n=1 Tax=Steinernema glaseri TaxID=37863 RepID=A0A1I8AV55_9BILA